MKHIYRSFCLAAIAYLCAFSFNMGKVLDVNIDLGYFSLVLFFVEMLPLVMLVAFSPRKMPMRKILYHYLFWNVLICISSQIYPDVIGSNKFLNFLCSLTLNFFLWIVLFRILQLSQRFSFVWWSAVSYLFVELTLSIFTIIRIFGFDFSDSVLSSYDKYLYTTYAIECIPPVVLCISVAQFYKTFRS